MFRLMRNECPEITSHNAVPCWTILLVKKCFYVFRDVFFLGVSFKCGCYHSKSVVLKKDNQSSLL